MSNSAGANTSREEEIAFLAIEHVLGVSIDLADSGGGNSMPDGSWSSPSGRGIVEVTTPPAHEQMAEWARAKKNGEQLSESGCTPAHLNELAELFMEMLEEDWAVENIKKLQAQSAEQRHLYLASRSEAIGSYFYRLSDEYENGPMETIADIELPPGISDLWFQGRMIRGVNERFETIKVLIARFQSGFGWHRHLVEIDDLALPSPNPGIADDPVPAGLRKPKRRA